MSRRPILGSDVYLALAAVGWADGQLTEQGADAIVKTALDEGLTIEEIVILEEAVKNKVEVGAIDWYAMSKADRLYVYAVAVWIAALDGHVSKSERRALSLLGDALKLPDAPRARARQIMKEIAALADRPERFDFPALRYTLDARLDAAHTLRSSGADEG
jgi:uncharacterized membrane protein YebE (DUF533 family)